MIGLQINTDGSVEIVCVPLECAGHQWLQRLLDLGFGGLLLHFHGNDVVARTLALDGARNRLAEFVATNLDAAIDEQQFVGAWLVCGVDEEQRVCDLEDAQVLLWEAAVTKWRQDLATGTACRVCFSEYCLCHERN